MKSKSSIELSGVQIKVLDELELLSDAFVSTFNEIGNILKPFVSELDTLLENFIANNKSWTFYHPECFDISYSPFTEYSFNKKFSIEVLQNNFSVGGQKTLTRQITMNGKQTQVDLLVLDWGFNFDMKERIKHFSFHIHRKNKERKIVFNTKEYDKKWNKIKIEMEFPHDEFYEFFHPEDGDNKEFVTLWLPYNEIKKFPQLFELYKEEFVEPYLAKIKD